MEKMREKSVLMVNMATKTVKVETSDSNRPSPQNFDTFMPWICKQYGEEVVVLSTECLTKSMQIRSMKLKNRKKSDATDDVDASAAVTTTDVKGKISSVFGSSVFADSSILKILATYDFLHNLTKIEMHNNKEIPRKVLKILSLIIQFYPVLTTLTVNSGINMYSILEISKFLPRSALKEIYLDGTRLSYPNYHILLETASNLNCLSLARCQINDEILKHITDLLAFPLPASKTLIFLNLSSNRISDKGAAYLAEALRSNRQLACLNLSDNHISDAGASHIFDILVQFPISEEELVQSESRRFKYIKQKTQLVAQFLVELKIAGNMKTFRKKTVPGLKELVKSTPIPDHTIMEKAECLAIKTLGENKDPFRYPNSFCVGNTTLASLNLSYNNLSYVTLKKLLKVLNYQKNIMGTPRGLFRVRMEGNYLPTMTEEYAKINELLKSSIDFHQPMTKKKTAIK